MSTNAQNMRKLMENINPAQEMDVTDIPVDNMGAMDNNGDMGMEPEMGDVNGTAEYVGDQMAAMGGEEVGMSTDIIDALEGEFKRLTTDFLQTGGELDEAGLSDVREKLGKHMTSILDVLHSGWMDNMMDQGANEEAPDFGGEGDDSEGDSDSPVADSDGDDDGSDDSEAEEKDDDSDSDDKEETSDDSDDDSDDKDDSGEEGENFNFDEAHLNESPAYAMRKLQDKMLKG